MPLAPAARAPLDPAFCIDWLRRKEHQQKEMDLKAGEVSVEPVDESGTPPMKQPILSGGFIMQHTLIAVFDNQFDVVFSEETVGKRRIGAADVNIPAEIVHHPFFFQGELNIDRV